MKKWQRQGAARYGDEIQSPDYYERSNNYYTWDDLAKAQGKVPVLGNLEQVCGLPKADKYRVKEPEYIKKLSEVYTDKNVLLIRDTLIVHYLAASAWMLDLKAFNDKNKKMVSYSSVLFACQRDLAAV